MRRCSGRQKTGAELEKGKESESRNLHSAKARKLLCQHTHTHTHTHAHRFGEGGTEKSKTSLPFQTGQLTMILAYMSRICTGKFKKMFFPSSLFRNSLVSGSRCKYRTVAGLRGIRVRVNPGKIWGKNRRVGWGKGLIVSGSFFSELPTKKRFGETPKRGKASLLLSFFPFPLLQQSNN